MNATEPKRVEFDEHAELWEEYRRLKPMVDRFEKVKAELKRLAGEADEVTFNGEKIATNSLGTFQAAQFTKQFPNIAEQFMRRKPVLDVEALKKAHPFLVEQFRSRAFKPL